MGELQPCASCGQPASQLCPWTLLGMDGEVESKIWCDTPTCEIVVRETVAEAVAAWNERAQVEPEVGA